MSKTWPTTARGFEIYGKVQDSKGAQVRVQESSTASGPHAWIFCKRDGVDDDPHLTPEQARELAAALIAFAERAPSRWG